MEDEKDAAEGRRVGELLLKHAKAILKETTERMNQLIIKKETVYSGWSNDDRKTFDTKYAVTFRLMREHQEEVDAAKKLAAEPPAQRSTAAIRKPPQSIPKIAITAKLTDQDMDDHFLEVEQYFAAQDYPDIRIETSRMMSWRPLVPMMFSNLTPTNRRDIDAIPLNATWQETRTALKLAFVRLREHLAKARLYRKLTQGGQKGMTVKEYTKKFEDALTATFLGPPCPHCKHDWKTQNTHFLLDYVEGLDPRPTGMQRAVQVATGFELASHGFDALAEFAKKVEMSEAGSLRVDRQLAAHPPTSSAKAGRTDSRAGGKGKGRGDKNGTPGPQRDEEGKAVCARCGRANHETTDCTAYYDPQGHTIQTPRPGRQPGHPDHVKLCNVCQSPDHAGWACPPAKGEKDRDGRSHVRTAPASKYQDDDSDDQGGRRQNRSWGSDSDSGADSAPSSANTSPGKSPHEEYFA
jgi:hypothetical protein